MPHLPDLFEPWPEDIGRERQAAMVYAQRNRDLPADDIWRLCVQLTGVMQEVPHFPSGLGDSRARTVGTIAGTCLEVIEMAQRGKQSADAPDMVRRIPRRYASLRPDPTFEGVLTTEVSMGNSLIGAVRCLRATRLLLPRAFNAIRPEQTEERNQENRYVNWHTKTYPP